MAADTASRRGGFTVLVWVYIVLTLAALGRSGYQLATKFEEAPLAYLLSAVAAVVYLVATIGLMTHVRQGSRVVAIAALVIEAIGVLVIGTLSVLRPDLFPADTVWSRYGQGYLFIPLVLPFVGLWWLRRAGQKVAA
ncbi:MAG: Uncharacterised protein [Cellulomonadaceae bacterium TMED98]|nr:MAG: Uncharacterised protein [Cellulomonadaceae bacterium TMED98]